MKKIGLVVAGLIWFNFAQALPRVEVVQSVPLETALTVPGVLLTQQTWLDLINSAQKTIDLEEFYFSNQAGSALDPVLEALKSAANRGVQIRILVDAKFYVNYSNEVNALAKLPNVTLKTVDFSLTGGVMHAKYFVVDHSSGYLGSANFDWLALAHIHEIGLKVNDAQIADNLESIFNKDWGSGVAHQKTVASLGFFASPGSQNPAGISPTLDGLLALIGSAKTSLKIQNYEYNTKMYGTSAHFSTLDGAIRAAAARGVQVELLLDQNALKNGTADIKALAALKNITVKIIRIPAWSGGPLAYARLAHSKYCMVDDTTGWIGSENWSSGYFTGSRNVGLIFSDAEAVSQLAQVFSMLWSSTYVSSF